MADSGDPFDKTLERVRKTVGLTVELSAGAGLLGLGLHDMFAPAHLLLSSLHLTPVGADLAGLTLMGAGRPMVSFLKAFVGAFQ